MLLQGKRPFHAPPTYKTLSVNAHTPLNIIYFQLQIVLIPGKMDLKFTEMNATEMYVVNLKSHITAFRSLFRSLFILDYTQNAAYWIPTKLYCNSLRLKLLMKFIMALIKAVMLVRNSEFHLSICSFCKISEYASRGFCLRASLVCCNFALRGFSLILN